MPLDVFVFYNGLNEQSKGYPYLKSYGNIINQLVLFQIAIQNNGMLLGQPSRRLINEAHGMGIKVLLSVSNLTPQGFSTDLLGRLVRDQVFANLVWLNIRNLLLDYQFDGVNLDLEKAAPTDRPLFSQLIQTWSTQFQKGNFLVTIDVPGKSSGESLSIWGGSFDYQAIGQAVDEVVLMTYEEHWPGGPPGSVASLPWVTGVLNYALATIPPQKISMGIPLYGYDWPEIGVGQVISYPRAIGLAQRYGVPLQWDATQHSTYFSYEAMGVHHTVYFEDPRSIKEKLDLASSKGLRSIALWEMKLSYPLAWEVLRPYVSRT